MELLYYAVYTKMLHSTIKLEFCHTPQQDHLHPKTTSVPPFTWILYKMMYNHVTTMYVLSECMSNMCILFFGILTCTCTTMQQRVTHEERTRVIKHDIYNNVGVIDIELRP